MAEDVEGLTSPVRVRYFSGMLLTAEDFETDQTYHRYKRMLHNRYLHGAGVVWGLEVSVSGAGAITVEPGLAVDSFGREIVVPEPATAQLPDPPGDLLRVCLEYDEVETDPEPAPNVAADGAQASRIREGYRIHVIPMTSEGEDGSEDEDGCVVLATIRASSGSFRVDVAGRSMLQGPSALHRLIEGLSHRSAELEEP